MLEIITFFIFGLFFGSFYLVVADRFGIGKSFITGRSICEFCDHPLAWFELIPLLSFLIQRGKCRHCKKQLSWWYPTAELSTGILFGFIYSLFMPLGVVPMLFALVISSCLLIIFITDYKYEIIPFPVVVFGSITALIQIVLSRPEALVNHLLTALLTGLFFLIIFLVTKGRGMGFGDVVYAVFMGLLLGFPYILAGLYITFVGGAIISLILVLLKKKKLHGGTVPFGPFLVAGTFIMLIAGQQVMEGVNMYLGGML